MDCIVMGGCGQVGTAIANILEENGNRVHVLDKKGDYKPPAHCKYNFLHVCIPFSDYFLETVGKAVREYDPDFVIVHSTVPVGTTRKIGSFAAHSPIRGNHPDLEGGVKSFVKYVGAHNDKTRAAVSAHMRGLGLKVEEWPKAEDTELAKLLCLARYLNDLAFYETSYKACKKFSVPPIRLIEWTWTYNDGYKGTKHKRAELTFPMGKVGGHCVMPVSKMLSGQTGYKFFKRNLDVFVGSR